MLLYDLGDDYFIAAMTILSTTIEVALFGFAYAESWPLLAINLWASVFGC